MSPRSSGKPQSKGDPCRNGKNICYGYGKLGLQGNDLIEFNII